MEISRWWSAAKPPEFARIKDSAPNGAAESALNRSPAPLPGRPRFGTGFRWFSLPSVAPPPANFRCPSGTHLLPAVKVHDRL